MPSFVSNSPDGTAHTFSFIILAEPILCKINIFAWKKTGATDSEILLIPQDDANAFRITGQFLRKNKNQVTSFHFVRRNVAGIFLFFRSFSCSKTLYNLGFSN